MGRVMGCGLCPYSAIEKVGNYAYCHGQARSPALNGSCYLLLASSSTHAVLSGLVGHSSGA